MKLIALFLIASASLVTSFAPSTRTLLVNKVHTPLLIQKQQLCRVQTTQLHAEASAQITEVAKPAETKSLAQTLKVGSFFALWYALNIGYNIYNKNVLTIAPGLTWTIALLQLFMGLLYVIPVWVLGIRKTPELTGSEIKALLPVAVSHLLTHIGAIISLGAGAVSFTHIVKAAEPAGKYNYSLYILFVFTMCTCYLILLQYPLVYPLSSSSLFCLGKCHSPSYLSWYVSNLT